MKISIMVTSAALLLTAQAAAAQGQMAPRDTALRRDIGPRAALRWPRTIGGAFGAGAGSLATADSASRAAAKRSVSYYRAAQPTGCFSQSTPMPTMRSSITEVMPNVAGQAPQDTSTATASRACADSNRRR